MRLNKILPFVFFSEDPDVVERVVEVSDRVLPCLLRLLLSCRKMYLYIVNHIKLNLFNTVKVEA